LECFHPSDCEPELEGFMFYADPECGRETHCSVKSFPKPKKILPTSCNDKK